MQSNVCIYYTIIHVHVHVCRNLRVIVIRMSSHMLSTQRGEYKVYTTNANTIIFIIMRWVMFALVRLYLDKKYNF